MKYSTFPVSTDIRSRVKTFDNLAYNEHITRIPGEETLMFPQIKMDCNLKKKKKGLIFILLLHIAQEKND